MCNPAAIQIAMTVAAAAMSAKAQHDQGQYQKGVANYNAAVDRNKATETRNVATAKESDARTQASQMLSRQRAIAASRGVSVDFGTALDVQEDTALIGEINAMRIREQGAGAAGALETSADLGESAGDQAARQGTIGAAGTLVSGAASVAGSSLFKTNPAGGGAVAPKWYDFNKPMTTGAGSKTGSINFSNFSVS